MFTKFCLLILLSIFRLSSIYCARTSSRIDSPELMSCAELTLQGRVCDFMLSICSCRLSSEVILESMYIHVLKPLLSSLQYYFCIPTMCGTVWRIWQVFSLGLGMVRVGLGLGFVLGLGLG